jgi:hypothetical protein
MLTSKPNTKPPSEKRLAANRANAAKSTGPKTDAGKRVSSQNATRHGMLANHVLIEGESRERFLALVAEYDDEYKPATRSARDLVHTMAVCRWRTLRAWALESAEISYEIRAHLDSHTEENTPTRIALALRQSAANSGARQQDLTIRYETHNDLQYHRAAARLAQMKADQLLQERSKIPNEPTNLDENKGLVP